MWYNVFGQRVPDCSNLVIEKVNFSLIHVSTDKVHCCCFHGGDLNRPLESDTNLERQHRGNSNRDRGRTVQQVN